MSNSQLQHFLPSVLDEGVVMASMCLTTVDNDSHKFIVLWNCNFLPGGTSRRPISSALAFSATVLTSHSRDGVRLHVQHPGELYTKKKGFTQMLIAFWFPPWVLAAVIKTKVLWLGLFFINTPYPDLFVIFNGASTLPVKAESHEVNAKDTRKGFDACSFHSGSLHKWTNTNVS